MKVLILSDTHGYNETMYEVIDREAPFDIPILKNINVCSLFYALCTERKYSIPDVLRIKNYKIKQEISDWGNDEIQITI